MYYVITYDDPRPFVGMGGRGGVREGTATGGTIFSVVVVLGNAPGRTGASPKKHRPQPREEHTHSWGIIKSEVAE